MNYKKSKQILKEVKKAKTILLNCHRGPDPDSIGSALAMFQVLKKMGKDVEIVCPSEELFENISFLAGYSKIKTNVDFSSLDFSKYDLFITLDSSSWDMVSGDEKNQMPKIPVVVIDHHKSNTHYGMINLVDGKIASVGELLFRIFRDWRLKINKDVANCLMTATVGDTGAFRYPGSTERTFEAVGDLMKLGADKDKIISSIYRSEPFLLVKFWGEVLSRMKMDKKCKFVWSAIPYEIYRKLNKPENAKETAASLFTQTVSETNFGFIAIERERGKLAISFRSRTDFDTSKIAIELGGGGHVYASGATIQNLSFDQAVEKLLRTARKYAKKHKGKNK